MKEEKKAILNYKDQLVSFKNQDDFFQFCLKESIDDVSYKELMEKNSFHRNLHGLDITEKQYKEILGHIDLAILYFSYAPPFWLFGGGDYSERLLYLAKNLDKKAQNLDKKAQKEKLENFFEILFQISHDNKDDQSKKVVTEDARQPEEETIIFKLNVKTFKRLLEVNHEAAFAILNVLIGAPNEYKFMEYEDCLANDDRIRAMLTHQLEVAKIPHDQLSMVRKIEYFLKCYKDMNEQCGPEEESGDESDEDDESLSDVLVKLLFQIANTNNISVYKPEENQRLQQFIQGQAYQIAILQTELNRVNGNVARLSLKNQELECSLNKRSPSNESMPPPKRRKIDKESSGNVLSVLEKTPFACKRIKWLEEKNQMLSKTKGVLFADASTQTDEPQQPSAAP